MKIWLHRLLTLGIISIFVFLTIQSAYKESLTFDEIFNLQEGATNLRTRTFPIEPYNPPLIRELAVIPEVLGFNPPHGVPNEIYFLNRLVIVALGVILLWQVIVTANEYFGYWPSLLSGILLALEPTFLANSHYITPDIGLTLFIFLTYKAFLNVLVSPTSTRYFFLGVFLGLSFATKISAIPFLLVTFLIVFIMKRKTFSFSWHNDHVGSTLFSLIVAAFVIWMTFFFHFSPILVKQDNPNRLSNKLLTYASEQQLAVLTSAIHFMQGTPVPLGDYFGLVKNNILRFQSPQTPFYFGSFRSGVAWYMIPVILLIKLPHPFMFMIGLGIFLLLAPESFIKRFITFEEKFKRNVKEQSLQQQKELETMDEYQMVPRYKIRVQYDERMDKEWNYLFIIPVVAIIGVAIVTKMAPLVRYILPVFPFLAIIAGSSIQTLRSAWKKVLIIFVLIWYGFVTVSAHPHFISFTNASVPPNQRYLYLMDSNLDWGQGLLSMEEYYLKSRPATIQFSYFGRDDAAWYGFPSSLLWGSYKNDEICQFHTIKNSSYGNPSLTAISVSNWYNCGYYKQPLFAKDRIKEIVGDSILMFNGTNDETEVSK